MRGSANDWEVDLIIVADMDEASFEPVRSTRPRGISCGICALRAHARPRSSRGTMCYEHHAMLQSWLGSALKQHRKSRVALAAGRCNVACAAGHREDPHGEHVRADVDPGGTMWDTLP